MSQNHFEQLDEWAKKHKLDAKNPNKMVRKFGKFDDLNKCGSCKFLVCYESPSGKNYYKCEKFGYSKSEASDFRKKWNACKKFETGETRVVRDI